MKQITKRLKPDTDLRQGIQQFVRENDVQAGVVASLVGSLSKAVLRMAGAKEVKEYEGSLEIVSVTGTVSVNGSHIHITVSDQEGQVFGGHLVKGCIVRTSAELSILKYENVIFRRESDDETGFDELVIE